MKDNRKDKKFIDQIEPDLENLSDNYIMLNFQQALYKLYPHLIQICSFCYDSWDSIVETLYDEMVLKTLCWKYGLRFNIENFHRYAFELNNHKGIHHIECFFKVNKVNIISEFGISNLTLSTYFESKKIIFKEFCDGKHSLTGSITKDEAMGVEFNLVRALLIDVNDVISRDIYFDVNDIYFELVLEDT